MAKKKGKCVQCKKEIIGDIRCASCKARNKHFSPSQKNWKKKR